MDLKDSVAEITLNRYQSLRPDVNLFPLINHFDFICIFIYIAPLDSENEIHGSSAPEEDLHELLEAAERRKSTEIHKTAKSFTLIVGIPVGLLLLWAAIFLITYDPGPQKVTEVANSTAPVTSITTPGQLTPEQQEDAQYDMFRDEKDRVVKTNVLGLKETSGQLVDKEDIRFAMELMNFMHAPPAAEEKKK